MVQVPEGTTCWELVDVGDLQSGMSPRVELYTRLKGPLCCGRKSHKVTVLILVCDSSLS